MKLYAKFSIPLVILVVFVSILLNYIIIRSEEERLYDYINKFGVSLVSNLASNSELGVFTGNETYLEKPIKAISKEKDVVFAFVLDVEASGVAGDDAWNVKERGKVLAHSDQSEVGKVYSDSYSEKALDAQGVTVVRRFYPPAGEDILDFSAPIFKEVKKKPKKESFDALLEEGGEELFFDKPAGENEPAAKLVKKGVARVALSLAPLQTTIAQMKRKVLWVTISMVILLLVVLTSLFRFITKPIMLLADAAKKIAGGDYAQRVVVKSNDAIGTLGESFNYMSDNLNQSMKRMELTSNFNQTLILANNLSELLDTILAEILNARKINSGAIMLFNNQRNLFVVKGTSELYTFHKALAKNSNFLDWFIQSRNISDAQEYLERFENELNNEYNELRKLGVVMTIPLHTKDEVIGLFSFGAMAGGKEYSDADIKFLSNLIQSAVIAIDNIILREKEAESEIMKFELEFAKKVQESLLPEANPNIQGFDIYTLCIPAKDIGGDYFDFIQLNEGGLGISIADVSGKGVPAALYMASTRSLLRSIAVDHQTSCSTLTRINDLLFDERSTNTFVTMFYAIIDSKTKTLNYTNAGHTFPLHYKDHSKACSYLINAGLPLGIASPQNYNSSSVTLAPGELILFYTDGIVEAMNEEDELFGFERLEALVNKYGHLAAKDFIDKTMEELMLFVGENPFQDDLTIVAMKITS